MKKRRSRRTFIIAEAGVNHNGSVRIAKKMIDVAAKAGADAVKFQTFKAEDLATRTAPKAKYQKKSMGKNSQFAMLKKLELDIRAHKELIRYCRLKRIIFLSSPFDLKSVDLLNSLGLKIFKIASGEITNLPLLRKIGKLKKRVILSTGMSTLEEAKKALSILQKAGTKKNRITLLHCNTEYPTPIEDVNLRAMLTMGKALNIDVGYSDHTLGIEVPIAAVALGAKVIEKHFTLDRNMKGPDHAASLEPAELKDMIKAIRNIENALGNNKKQPSASELKNKAIIRKAIVAAKPISKGELFTEHNITVKRPAAGIGPMRWDTVINKIAKRDFKEDEAILL
ncbi:MAG: N-acetylneuraminate synthase [Candidatus Omnitrophica bacterium]|nr:N-acetylneuraminate synthase [Candidatus Omnitrophota bacterium]